MKVLNLSINITKVPKNIESIYQTQRVDFVRRLTQPLRLSHMPLPPSSRAIAGWCGPVKPWGELARSPAVRQA